MSTSLKSWLTFTAVFLFLIVIAFNSFRYWEREDKQVELTAQQQERALQNDSINTVILTKLAVIDSLMTVKKTEQTNRTNNNTAMTRRQEVIRQATANEDAEFINEFLNLRR
jgi:hypothetical protein